MSDSNAILGIGSRVNHPAYGDGVVIGAEQAAYKVCFTKFGIKHVGKQYSEWEVIEAIETSDGVTFNDMEKSLIKILRTWGNISEVVDLGDKWNNGVVILRPHDENLKDKEIPMEAFFHKIVMIRDRLRIIEQRINAHKVLTEEDKVNLQQYITRSYGSLTSFNVLFKYKDDHFKGQSV